MRKLISYAPGDGALAFSYIVDGKAVGSPKTIEEVEGTIKELGDSFHWLVGKFSPGEIRAFCPVVRSAPFRLRMFAYGSVLEVNYAIKRLESEYATYSFSIVGSGETMRNMSIIGALTFWLNNEQRCTAIQNWYKQRSWLVIEP